MTDEGFRHTHLRAVNKRVLRLGLATNYGLDGRGFAKALDHGVNYVFWSSLRSKDITPVFAEKLKADRERYVIATGPTTGWFAGSYRRGVEKALKTLGVEYLDVFHLFWLGVGSALTESTMGELVKLKEEGKIRAIGCSIHDRERAGRLAADSPIDLFMLRYNAAHPGAERDVFPHLAKRNPSVVAYTATSWRKLLKRPSGWQGRVATAPDCYRFCLSSPHVDLVLTGPANEAQLDENLAALDRGPLSDDEMTWIREFGRVVHG